MHPLGWAVTIPEGKTDIKLDGIWPVWGQRGLHGSPSSHLPKRLSGHSTDQAVDVNLTTWETETQPSSAAATGSVPLSRGLVGRGVQGWPCPLQAGGRSCLLVLGGSDMPLPFRPVWGPGHPVWGVLGGQEQTQGFPYS